ncbi:neutral cholesterol ester hydrolase 1 [Strongylocentrotus purpuratus]|uniref:Alpha/beta hydrolase fold-3 domain-containing protein n=1 Tax=Strongylocentrotus purpuratus TaxID=7668 RepID=A0A7M7HJI0_STRPU|nr:neutral cholesterol ester hydrolase 1 [Strongylocentrotus purpuratus]
MRTRTKLLTFLAGMGILVSYAFYKPVPDGFAEPWQYRTSATISQAIQGLNYVRMCVRDRRCPNIFEELVEAFSIFGTFVGDPPEEVPGSNIRSRVTSFDGIRVRVYEPNKKDGEGDLPAFLYFHGGGLAVGNIAFYDPAVRMISERVHAVGIAVTYRLAPKHVFPAAFDDAFAATKWFLSHADELGVDPTRVALIGDSAGGLLAALVSGAISDEPSLPDIKLQVLIYPWLQSFDHNTPSMQKGRCQHGGFGQTVDMIGIMPYFVTAYTFGSVDEHLGQQIYANNHTSAAFKQSEFYQKHLSHDLIPADMKPDCYVPPTSDFGDDELWENMKDALTSTKYSPLYREDFSKLPRSFVATFGYDCLRDDGIFYAKRLEYAGVPVKWVNYEDGFHGIAWFGDNSYEIGRQMADDFIEYTKEHL